MELRQLFSVHEHLPQEAKQECPFSLPAVPLPRAPPSLQRDFEEPSVLRRNSISQSRPGYLPPRASRMNARLLILWMSNPEKRHSERECAVYVMMLHAIVFSTGAAIFPPVCLALSV